MCRKSAKVEVKHAYLHVRNTHKNINIIMYSSRKKYVSYISSLHYKSRCKIKNNII